MHQSVSFVSFIFTLYFFCCFLGIGGASCPSGWVPFQSHCYKFVSDLKTWSESQKQCQQQGAYLVKISSNAENEFVRQNKKTANAWLGLHRGSHHKFYWRDGTKPVYKNWASGEPNDAGGKEDCGHMWDARGVGTWNDIPCNKKFSSVCEKTSCPSGWVPFQDQCYKFVSQKQTWSDSQKQCKQHGADLVKISSKAENDFVRQNKKTANAWLGLHRGSHHKFYWRDGTKPVYKNWGSGEPNNHGGNENCGHMWNRAGGTWNDATCQAKFSSVCEKSPKTCGSNNGGCSHKCVNTAGGYRCECPDPELTLSQDKHTCVASGVKVSCGPDQMAIDIPKSILDNIHKQDLTLNSKSCGAKENSTHFSLVAPLNGCGTVSKETKYQIVYTNKVLETAVANGSIITRVRPVEITFSCSYPRHETISAVGHKPIYTKLKFRERENGTLFHALALDIFPNNKFKTPFKKLPASVKLRQLLYIQASLKSADKQLSINTERCFATPKRDPYSKPAHNLIVNSCPVDHGVTFLPSPTRNVRRFSVKAFKLVGPSKKFVFIHCDILICNAADANSACTKQCKSGSQQRKREYTGTAKQTVTGGPMTFEDETLAELEFGNDVDREDSLPMDTDTEIDNYYT